jgi:hypothetical protein
MTIREERAAYRSALQAAERELTEKEVVMAEAAEFLRAIAYRSRKDGKPYTRARALRLARRLRA